MQAEPNKSSQVSANTFEDAKKIPSLFLIHPSDRRQFFGGFVLMTIIGWVVGGTMTMVLVQIVNQRLIPNANLTMQWIWHYSWFYASTALFALIFAIDQALVMRKHVSGWLWLLATFLGWLFSQSISHSWITYIQTVVLSLDRDLVTVERVVFTSLSTIAANVAWVWLGFSQWVVLRKYTKNSWWWIFLHTLSFFVISFLVWLLSLGHDFIPEAYRENVLFVSEQIISAAALAIISAIAACRLKSNRSSHNDRKQ